MWTSDTKISQKAAASVAGKIRWLHEAGDLLSIDNQVCNECNGFGRVKVTTEEENPDYIDLWLQAEDKNPSGDGTHAVECLSCLGHGRNLDEIMF
jgi:hypothetical protein